MSRRTVARMESDNVRSVTVQTVRCVFAAAGAHARIVASWNGAALDRLLDERHAALVERVARILQVRNWTTMVEQTFSEYGERGSIDLLGWHKPSRSLVVTEVKSALGNLEETNRSLDTKVRLAPRLLREKLGVPATVSRLLVLPSGVDRAPHGRPARGRQIRAWLRRPDGSMAGLRFLSEGQHRATPRSQRPCSESDPRVAGRSRHADRRDRSVVRWLPIWHKVAPTSGVVIW